MCAGSQVIFRVRRPMYLINSTIYVEDGDGTTIVEWTQCPLATPPTAKP